MAGKFADNGEFSGMGVPEDGNDAAETQATAGDPQGSAQGAAEGSAQVSGEAAQETAAKAGKAGSEKKEAGQEAGAEGKADGAGQEDGQAGGKDAGQDTAPCDPLDMPITDFSSVDLGLGDAPVDKVVIEAYGAMCEELKLTPRQAASLAQFELRSMGEARERLTAEAIGELKRDWGKEAQANQLKIVELVKRIDQQLGGNDFSQALEASGVTCYAPFAKGLLALTEMLGEHNLGAIGGTGAGQKTETALDGLTEIFNKARK